MSVSERDPHSGHMTTGHEWNGIKELNTPVPRPVWFFLIVTALFAVGYWILMPAWPLGHTYTRGLLGADQRKAVAQGLAQADAGRSGWEARILTLPYDRILADPALMTIVRDDGHRLFGDNCAACHGIDARGGKGFPNLTDSDWLWGGAPDTIARTIQFGVNSSKSPQTRVSQMPAFGRDKLLDNDSILAVADYVRSLSGSARGASAASIAKGKTVFAANCVACHGPDARGNQTLGVPNLTDRIWLYGGDAQTVYTSIYEGRQGEMPAWEGRLSPLERKVLTVYVLDKANRP
jgi:cytochrome c oxidase cbb3-type subunit 3